MQGLKAYIRCPEGRYLLSTPERRPSLVFNPDHGVRLTLAELPGEGGGTYLVYNLHHHLFICHPAAPGREPLRVVDFRPAAGSGPVYPTCHAYAASRDDFDLLVGLNTGEVVVLSLRAQLRAPAGSTRAVSSLTYNLDGGSAPSRCASVAWLPGTHGAAFLAAHRDGTVCFYQKMVGSSSDQKLLARSSSSQSLRPPLTQLQAAGGAPLAAVAVSPDGAHLAVAGRDGVLRIYDHHSGTLKGGFKSYYGGLLCCAWSPDSKYVASGGEDDLISLFGLAERCVVACGQGHVSWASALAFDPWMCYTSDEAAADDAAGFAAAPASPLHPSGRAGAAAAVVAPAVESCYRLASAGQDCQICLWDVVVSEEAVAAAQAGSATPRPDARGRSGGGGFSFHRLSPGKQQGSRSGSPVKGLAAGGFRRSMDATSSLPQLIAEGIIAPPVTRADMPLITPIAQQKAHFEPMSDVVFTEQALLTACHGGNFKVWMRPPVPEQQRQQHEA